MHKYFLKIPWWVRWIFPSYIWKVPVADKSVYLTFDDGPHPTITPWVLGELRKYGATATFFCIGRNVATYPEAYKQIIAEGHSVGHHTFSHLNGWKTPTRQYLDDAAQSGSLIDSNLFRPPYGRIRKNQARKLADALGKKNVKVVMWDVLSADFDASMTPKMCAETVLRHTEKGSVIVFHDSEKAYTNLRFALPFVLKELKNKGFLFRKL